MSKSICWDITGFLERYEHQFMSVTWPPSSLVMAQLTAAVGATGVNTPIMQQEERVLAAARNFFKTPPIEHATAPRLKDKSLRRPEAQLTRGTASPAQHHDSHIKRETDGRVWNQEELLGCTALRSPPVRDGSGTERKVWHETRQSK